MNSWIKRLLALFFVLAFILFIPIPCAADSTVSFDEFGFSVTFPSNLIVFTRDTDPASLQWAIIGLDPEAFLPYMESNNLYADAIYPDVSYEITVIVKQEEKYKEYYNFNDYSDNTLLNTLSDYFEAAANELDATASQLHVYKHGNYKFLHASVAKEKDGGTVYGSMYFTIVNGIYVQITLRSIYRPLDINDVETIEAVVDSVHFKEINRKPGSNTAKGTVLDILADAITGAVAAAIVSLPVTLFFLIRKKKAGKKPAEDSTRRGSVAYPVGVPDKSVSSVNYCGKCSGELPLGVKYCPHCGWRL